MVKLPSSLVIVGTGRVAEAFIRFFTGNKQVDLSIVGRNKIRLQELNTKYAVKTFDDIEKSNGEWAIVAVSDNALNEIIPKIKSSFISITAGTADYTEFGKNCTILYPLQTFSKRSEVKLDEIPIVIDGNVENLEILKCWTNWLGFKTHHYSIQKREKLHVVAVFLNNFVHHIMSKGIVLAKDFEIDPSIFEPLLQETINRLDLNNPSDQQTGPAHRNDENTMDKHRKYLNEENLLLYNMLSKSIKLSKDGKL